MNNKRKFYGFQYTDGPSTTTGTPNTDPGRYNGRLSIAGSAHIFRSRKQRDEWVKSTDNATSVTLRELRQLRKGMEKSLFDEWLEAFREV